MPGKKESKMSLNSEFSGDFRSGLRLPILPSKSPLPDLDEKDGDVSDGEVSHPNYPIHEYEARKGEIMSASASPSTTEAGSDVNMDFHRFKVKANPSPSLASSDKNNNNHNSNHYSSNSHSISRINTNSVKRFSGKEKSHRHSSHQEDSQDQDSQASQDNTRNRNRNKGKEAEKKKSHVIEDKVKSKAKKVKTRPRSKKLTSEKEAEDDFSFKLMNYDTDEGLASAVGSLTLASESGSQSTFVSNQSQSPYRDGHDLDLDGLDQDDPPFFKLSSKNSITKGNKGNNLEFEINQKISSVYRSIENLEKKRVNFNNSVRAATRRTVADGVRIKNKSKWSKLLVSTTSSSTLESDALQNQQESQGQGQDLLEQQLTPHSLKKPSRIIDVTRTYPKMFGLDPMKVIASSEDDSDVDENGIKDPRKKTKKSIRKYLEQLVKEEQPRDMSAIMPTLSEKTFLTKLQKRENQLNKEINDMRTNLDVMNMKAEREAKKAKVDRNQNQVTGSGSVKRSNVTKLMGTAHDKGTARELTDYLQATGGSAGGWETEDHHAFLRCFKKWYAHPTKLVANLCQLLPNKKPEDIVEHVAWYEKYDKLNNANRAHIRQWQIKKRKEREVVFRMGAQPQKAILEVEKRHQDIIQMKRAEERQKNKDILTEWKRSKGRRRRNPLLTTTAVNFDDVNEVDTSEKIAKMDLELSGIRKEVQEITSLTKDIGKTLRTANLSNVKVNPTMRKSMSNSNLDRDVNIRDRVLGMRTASLNKMKQKGKGRTGTPGTAGSEGSSGFCEMTKDEIDAVRNDLAGDGEKFLRSHEDIAGQRALSKPPMFSTKLLQRDPTQVAEAKKMLQEFRHRDAEMMEAKKNAILGKKEKMRSKTLLTDQQLKERMKKISAPSKVMNPTKQWEIRKEIRDLEKEESKNREEGNDNNPWTRVNGGYNPSAYVKNIPKLGMPSWRRNLVS